MSESAGTTKSITSARVELRAELSRGSSAEVIYELVGRELSRRKIRDAVLVDVGCGTGSLRKYVGAFAQEYVGVDVIRYPAFPDSVPFHKIDLDTGRAPLAEGIADVAVAVETIEHLENPRALMRELTRLARPGGWVIVTTPNQLSLLSLACLIVKQRHAAFQDVNYPAHITALIEVDLRRMATECGLDQIQISYSMRGRVVFTSRNFPRFVSRLFPRLLSDNILVIGRRPNLST